MASAIAAAKLVDVFKKSPHSFWTRSVALPDATAAKARSQDDGARGKVWDNAYIFAQAPSASLTGIVTARTAGNTAPRSEIASAQAIAMKSRRAVTMMRKTP